MVRVLIFLIAVGLAVYALSDVASSDEHERGAVPKGVWFAVVVLIPILGPLIWILIKRSAAGRYEGPQSPKPSGPIAPDDDPEFLWKLDQERLRREREQQREERDGDSAN